MLRQPRLVLRQLGRPPLEALVPLGELVLERLQSALLGREVSEARLSRVECGLAPGERPRSLLGGSRQGRLLVGELISLFGERLRSLRQRSLTRVRLRDPGQVNFVGEIRTNSMKNPLLSLRG